MTKSTRTRPRGLTQEAVVATSLEIARTEGFKSVTMREVASRLNVTPMALYRHVASKEELVVLVAQAVMTDAPRLGSAGEDWEDELREFLLSRWEALVQYPGLASQMLDHPTIGLSMAKETPAFFESLGFPPKEAQLTTSFVFTYLFGLLNVDAQMNPTLSSEPRGALSARDHAVFGVDAVVTAVRCRADRVRNKP